MQFLDQAILCLNVHQPILAPRFYPYFAYRFYFLTFSVFHRLAGNSLLIQFQILVQKYIFV